MLQWYAVLVILLDIGIIIEISFHLIQRWYKLDGIFKKSILWFNGRSNWFDYWLSFVICECIIVTSNVWSTPINYSIFAMSVAILSFFPRPIRNRTDKRRLVRKWHWLFPKTDSQGRTLEYKVLFPKDRRWKEGSSMISSFRVPRFVIYSTAFASSDSR